MSRARIDKIIKQIEDLQAQEPPGPRGDDGPSNPERGSLQWYDDILSADFRPTIGGRLPDSAREAIESAAYKARIFRDIGLHDLSQKWEELGGMIMEVMIDRYGLDAVLLAGQEDNPHPLAITAADIREAVKDNPNWQTEQPPEKVR